jgi:hypothetical protein
MRTDHRWLGAAFFTAPPTDEVAPPTQGLTPGGRDSWQARSYTAWSACTRGGEGR